jgi:hypothetical protein
MAWVFDRESRRERALAGRAAEAGLSPAVASTIAAVVVRARLLSSERDDIFEELVAHFDDGLASGVPESELLAAFGDPSLTSTLIGRSKRRGRPLVWKLRRLGTASALLFAMCFALLYGVSAFRLYAASPESTTSAPGPVARSGSWPLFEEAARELAAARTTEERGRALALARRAASLGRLGDTPPPDWEQCLAAAVPRRESDPVSTLWPIRPPAAPALVGIARALVEDARRAASDGHDRDRAREAGDDLVACFAIAGQLRESGDFASELAALEVLDLAAATTRDALRVCPEAFPDPVLADLEARAAALATDGEIRLRVETARAALGGVIDRMYSRDGRLTGGGLRMLQSFVGKHDPSAVALALEPIYFSMPAERDEVRAEAGRLLDLVEAAAAGPDEDDSRGRVETELRHLDGARAFRLFPVASLLPRVVAALDESTKAGRSWSECVDAIARLRRARSSGR